MLPQNMKELLLAAAILKQRVQRGGSTESNRKLPPEGLNCDLSVLNSSLSSSSGSVGTPVNQPINLSAGGGAMPGGGAMVPGLGQVPPTHLIPPLHGSMNLHPSPGVLFLHFKYYVRLVYFSSILFIS